MGEERRGESFSSGMAVWVGGWVFLCQDLVEGAADQCVSWDSRDSIRHVHHTRLASGGRGIVLPSGPLTVSRHCPVGTARSVGGGVLTTRARGSVLREPPCLVVHEQEVLAVSVSSQCPVGESQEGGCLQLVEQCAWFCAAGRFTLSNMSWMSVCPVTVQLGGGGGGQEGCVYNEGRSSFLPVHK